MVNAGHSLTDLKESFGHDARTMKSWGAALKSDDPEFIIRIFSEVATEPMICNATFRPVTVHMTVEQQYQLKMRHRAELSVLTPDIMEQSNSCAEGQGSAEAINVHPANGLAGMKCRIGDVK